MTAAETTASIERVRERIAGLPVTVIGGARSGLAVAKLLARRGANVFLTEFGPLAPEAAGGHARPLASRSRAAATRTARSTPS